MDEEYAGGEGGGSDEYAACVRDERGRAVWGPGTWEPCIVPGVCSVLCAASDNMGSRAVTRLGVLDLAWTLHYVYGDDSKFSCVGRYNADEDAVM